MAGLINSRAAGFHRLSIISRPGFAVHDSQPISPARQAAGQSMGRLPTRMLSVRERCANLRPVTMGGVKSPAKDRDLQMMSFTFVLKPEPRGV